MFAYLVSSFLVYIHWKKFELHFIVALVLYRKRNVGLRLKDFYQCMWVKKEIGTHLSLATPVAHLATHQTTLRLFPVAPGH